MRIDRDLSGRVTFSTLKPGDVFVDETENSESSQRFCMVLETPTQRGENAIDLEFGTLYIFESSDTVTAFEDACLTVKAE